MTALRATDLAQMNDPDDDDGSDESGGDEAAAAWLREVAGMLRLLASAHVETAQLLADLASLRLDVRAGMQRDLILARFTSPDTPEASSTEPPRAPATHLQLAPHVAHQT